MYDLFSWLKCKHCTTTVTSPKEFSPLQCWFSLVELIWAHSNDTLVSHPYPALTQFSIRFSFPVFSFWICKSSLWSPLRTILSLTTISIRMRSVQVQQRSYEYGICSWNSGGNYCMIGHHFRYLFPGSDPGFQVRRGALKFCWGYFVWKITILPQTTGTCFIQKIYAPSSKNVFNETGACGFYAKKSCFLILGEGAAGAPPPPGSAPGFPRYYIVMRAERPISLRFYKMF